MEKPSVNLDSVSPTDLLLAWRGPNKQGAALGFDIDYLGLPPTEMPPNEKFPNGIKGIFAFLRTAEVAARKHGVLLNQIGDHEIPLLDIPGFFKITSKYRSSIPGNTEGISTLVTNINDRPVHHTRFMRFDNEGKRYFAITALQRYTDEELSPVSEEMESRYKSKPALRIAKPDRFTEYQKESRLVEKLETHTKASLPEIAISTCAALAKACLDDQLLLTTYENQMWVKEHKKDSIPIDVPNIYDPAAQFFGMKRSSKFPGFWELPTTENGITFLNSSEASSNPIISSVAETAFQSYSSLID